MRRDLVDGAIGRRARWQHDPNRARDFQLVRQIGEPGCGRRAVLRKRGDGFRIAVPDDDLMARAHQAARNIGAHPAEADDTDLHGASAANASGQQN